MYAAIAAFCRALQAERRSPKTVSWYRERLHHYANHADPPELTTTAIRSYLASLTSSPATVHASYRALRSFCKFLVAEGTISSNPMARIKVPKRGARKPKAVDTAVYLKLLRAAANDHDARILCILLLLGDTGIRAGELCNLRAADVDLAKRLITVIGKGDKQRLIAISQITVEAISAWQSQAPGYWLLPGRAGHLQITSLRGLLKRFAHSHQIAGRVNPHAFRHMFALSWLGSGGDISSLADFLGHEDISTTRHYLRFQTEHLRAEHSQHTPLNGVSLPA